MDQHRMPMHPLPAHGKCNGNTPANRMPAWIEFILWALWAFFWVPLIAATIVAWNSREWLLVVIAAAILRLLVATISEYRRDQRAERRLRTRWGNRL